jgi:plasmid stabilization system protein ParE
MTYEFHPDALVELEQTARYYGAREAGLDIRFVDSVEETIGRILEAPTRWRIIEQDIRRCLTHIFPHAILYTIEQDRILILAVMHCSREPGYWKYRLGEPAS